MENTKILLPRDAEGNPDWAYMEEYMKALEKRVTNSVTALNTLLGGGKHYSRIDVSKWQYFKVGKLFEIHPTKAYKLTNAQLLDNGQYPVVVNSAFNNGVGGYSSQTPTEQGNMITFSDTVDANTIFYQAEKFVGYPHVQGLYPLSYKEQWTANSLKFFASVFRKAALTKGFDYGNKFRRDIATEIEIKLPTTANGDPDFEYMEQYMLNVENKVKGTLKQIA